MRVPAEAINRNHDDRSEYKVLRLSPFRSVMGGILRSERSRSIGFSLSSRERDIFRSRSFLAGFPSANTLRRYPGIALL
jgi:hypothetical protein